VTLRNIKIKENTIIMKYLFKMEWFKISEKRNRNSMYKYWNVRYWKILWKVIGGEDNTRNQFKMFFLLVKFIYHE